MKRKPKKRVWRFRGWVIETHNGTLLEDSGNPVVADSRQEAIDILEYHGAEEIWRAVPATLTVEEER